MVVGPGSPAGTLRSRRGLAVVRSSHQGLVAGLAGLDRDAARRYGRPPWWVGSRTWTAGWVTAGWRSSGTSALRSTNTGSTARTSAGSSGSFAPTSLACNPHGIVQAGVHGLLLDAAMNFAINSALPGRDRTKATLEMKVETMRPALLGESYRLRGEVVRMARQVAYAEASVLDRKDALVSRSTGTFLLERKADAEPTGSSRPKA